MLTALTLSGSIRQGSLNRVLQHHVGRKLAEAGVAVTALELGEFPMPLFNEDLEPDGVPDAAPVLAQLFTSHDIIFWASPEYNGGLTPLTVNTLAWLSRQRPNPFRHPVFGIGGVSSGKYGTVMGQSHLRDSLSKLGAFVVPTLLGIGPGAGVFDADGNPTEKSVNSKIAQLVHDLTHCSRG
jgi:NAD(P)H-dependent FMN reductase